MRGLFHHGPRYADRMLEPLDEGHTPGTAIVVLDACIQGHFAITIRQTTQPNASIGEVALYNGHSLFNSIEHVPSRLEHLPGSGVCGLSMFPGAQYDRTIAPWTRDELYDDDLELGE